MTGILLETSWKWRWTADAMYVLRQMVDKWLDVQGSMALGFVDLEEAVDTVPREMVMATLRWMEYHKRKWGWLRACTRGQQQEWWWENEHRRSFWVRYWTEAGQCAEPAAVHNSTGPQQEDGDEGCHEETPLCRRPGPGGEWQTGATGDPVGEERVIYQTRAET